MIKGHVQIDLHNHRSGFTERIEQDNLITNAVSQLTDFVVGRRLDINNVMPLHEKALGGLMIFEDPLIASANNVLFPGDNFLVGYAGRSLNTDDLERGSINVAESQAVPNGYMTVWDFSTSQANGFISSMALTHASVDTYCPIAIRSLLNSSLPYGVRNYIKYEDNYAYFINTSTSIPDLYKYYKPSTNYLLTDNPDMNGENELVGEYSSFNTSEYYINGYDGLFYSAELSSSTGVGAVHLVIFLNTVLDSTYTKGSIYKINVPFLSTDSQQLNYYGSRIGTSSSMVASLPATVIDGIFYLVDYNWRNNQIDIYSCDLTSGGTEFTLSEPLCSIDDADLYFGSGTIPCICTYKDKSDGIVIYAYTTTVNASGYRECVLIAVHSDGEYKKYSRHVTDFSYCRAQAFSAANSMLYIPFGEWDRMLTVPNNYLGTICNMSQSFEKTNTTSMKVKYTLTNV